MSSKTTKDKPLAYSSWNKGNINPDGDVQMKDELNVINYSSPMKDHSSYWQSYVPVMTQPKTDAQLKEDKKRLIHYIDALPAGFLDTWVAKIPYI